MVNHIVTDIESLPHQVRDLNSRRLIDDAIAAYRGDALRAAIISTWNAVVNDIISKAREIAALGDPDAKKFIGNLDHYISEGKVGEIQRVERNILSTALKKIKTITTHEYEMLMRIKLDRNRCAHPAFTEEGELFQPSPDLVRSHIVYALECLLIRLPLQGVSALNNFKMDVTSASFPSTSDGVKKFVNQKYLLSSKDSLIENMIIEILKMPFSNGKSKFFDNERKLSWILSEISVKKPDIYNKVARTYINRKTHASTEKRLLRICAFLGVDQRIWSWISEPIKLNLIELIKNCNTNELIENFVFDAYYVKELKSNLDKKLESLKEVDQIEIISNYPYRDFISLAIKIYSRSKSFRDADYVGNALIVPISDKFIEDDIISLLDTVRNNGQIFYSWGTQEILVSVFDANTDCLKHTHSHWRSLVEEMTERNDGDETNTTSYPEIRSRLKL